MECIKHRITRQDLIDRYTTSYPFVVKVVVDIGRGIMAVDAAWHADLELLLLEDGSRQGDLWGINILPHEDPVDFIEYESLINIRPAQNNFGLEIADPAVRSLAKLVVDKLVDYGQGTTVREPAAAYGSASPGRTLSGFGCPTAYPCFKHHKQLTMEKWRSFEAYKRVLMIANEFGRAKAYLRIERPNEMQGLYDCYERALELFHITIEAGRLEGVSSDIIAGLLRLRERTAGLLVERKLDPEENQHIRDALIKLDPKGCTLFQPAATGAQVLVRP
jgi:hypothetical protein